MLLLLGISVGWEVGSILGVRLDQSATGAAAVTATGLVAVSTGVASGTVAVMADAVT
jgi:hypothetical protein